MKGAVVGCRQGLGLRIERGCPVLILNSGLSSLTDSSSKPKASSLLEASKSRTCQFLHKPSHPPIVAGRRNPCEAEKARCSCWVGPAGGLQQALLNPPPTPHHVRVRGTSGLGFRFFGEAEGAAGVSSLGFAILGGFRARYKVPSGEQRHVERGF